MVVTLPDPGERFELQVETVPQEDGTTSLDLVNAKRESKCRDDNSDGMKV